MSTSAGCATARRDAASCRISAGKWGHVAGGDHGGCIPGAGGPEASAAANRPEGTRTIGARGLCNNFVTVAFHAAALEAGGTDNGGPGVREIYHPSYYGAFVLDPDGNNVEAVCHKPA
jgi:hypothetical protein